MASEELAVKADLFSILDAVPDGCDALRLAITEGRISAVFPNVAKDTRQGCVKAHLAEHRQCLSSELPGAACCGTRWINGVNPISPVECYIFGVRYGDKPETNYELRTLLVYMNEWLTQREASEEDF